MNERMGIYISLQYLAPRKRKAITWSCTSDTLVEAIEQASEWRVKNGGRFISGVGMTCSLYDVEGNGEIITMQSVPIFAAATELTETELQILNRG